MVSVLQTAVETAAFIAEARRNLTNEERDAAINAIAADPERGRLIIGGGGIRKIRVAVAGRGKRGGARVIYYYHDQRTPIFLLTVFAKNEKSDLTARERNSLAAAAKLLARTYGAVR